MAKVIELIQSESKTGRGVDGDPVRTVNELWTKDGVLVAAYDQWKSEGWFIPPPPSK